MEIFRSEEDLSDPTDEEAAAIAAAIGAYLGELAAESDRDGDESAWRGHRWQFAGRIERVAGSSVRVPDGTPSNRWTAAGRRNLMRR